MNHIVITDTYDRCHYDAESVTRIRNSINNTDTIYQEDGKYPDCSHRQARGFYATIYNETEGTPKDLVSLYILGMSSDSRNIAEKAKHELAECYRNGNTVTKDPLLAKLIEDYGLPECKSITTIRQTITDDLRSLIHENLSRVVEDFEDE